MEKSAWFSAAVLCLAVLCGFVAADGKNYLSNPGFENNLAGWTVEVGACKVVTDEHHTGNKSLYCNDSSTSKRSFVYQLSVPIVRGLYYNISGWFKLKNVTGGRLLLCIESKDYLQGAYLYSDSVPACKGGTCLDKWYFMSKKSEMILGNSSRYTMSILLHAAGGTGEFWVDDLSLSPVRTNILGFIETTAWRQEAFEDPIEIYVNMLINNTAWHYGQYFTLKVDIVDGDKKVVDTINDFELGYREDNRIATFKYDPSSLKPGFYTVRATCVNELFDNYTETIETNLRKLEKKRDRTFYVDQKTLVAYDNGKPFFPIGVYLDMDQFDLDEYVDLLTDSPFNTIIAGPFGKDRLDHVYERSKGRIRVIDILTPFPGCNSNVSAVYERIVKTVKSWRESKGLLGYYIVDEPSVCHVPVLRNITLTVRDLDPNHVTYAAVAGNGEIDHRIKEGLDVFGKDCYPLQHYDDLHAIYIVAMRSRARTCNARIRWDIPQIFDWSFENRSNESPPNEQQLRQMVYQWIAGGGNGIIFFDLTLVKKMSYKNPWDKEWAKIKNVVTELNDQYVPIITSGYLGSPRFALPPLDNINGRDYVGRRTFYYNGYSYILIVNIRAQAFTYSFYKPSDVKAEDIQIIMQQSATKMTIVDDKITLSMPSTEVVWLRIYDPKWLPDEGASTVSASVMQSSSLFAVLIALVCSVLLI